MGTLSAYNFADLQEQPKIFGLLCEGNGLRSPTVPQFRNMLFASRSVKR